MTDPKEKKTLEKGPSIKISDGDVWLIFPDTLISIEAICNGSPGPIVQRNLRKWRDKILSAPQEPITIQEEPDRR